MVLAVMEAKNPIENLAEKHAEEVAQDAATAAAIVVVVKNSHLFLQPTVDVVEKGLVQCPRLWAVDVAKACVLVRLRCQK